MWGPGDFQPCCFLSYSGILLKTWAALMLCCRMGELRGTGEVDTFSIGFPYFSTFASFCPPSLQGWCLKKINAHLVFLDVSQSSIFTSFSGMWLVDTAVACAERENPQKQHSPPCTVPGIGWLGLPGGSGVKNPAANTGGARDSDLFPGSGRSPGVVNGTPLQNSCQGNFMDMIDQLSTSQMHKGYSEREIETFL